MEQVPQERLIRTERCQLGDHPRVQFTSVSRAEVRVLARLLRIYTLRCLAYPS
jgi:hypothetical protein